MEKNKKKISIWRILIYFIIFSFVGFVIETLFALVNYGVLESRKSFLYGPFSGVYGVGAVILILALRHFNKNNYTLFFGGCFTGAITEYTMSYIGEIFFHARWWDYSNKFLNINGRICLLYTIFWGILSLSLVRIIMPQVDRFIDFIANKLGRKKSKRITIICMILIIIDIIASAMAMQLFLIRKIVENDLNVENKIEIKEEYEKIYGNGTISKFINEFWNDKKMIKTYPNVTLEQTDGSIVYLHDLVPDVKPYIHKFEI